MSNRTIKQHYVQEALLKNWENEGLVGVAKKTDNYLIKEKNKSASSLFFEIYGYEVLHGFDSMPIHAKNDYSISLDQRHPLKINDGEKYCKSVEDSGLPIIRRIIAAEPYYIKLTGEEKESIYKYLILQSIRTPGGRRKYLPKYPNIRIDENSTNDDTFDQFIGNILYLMVMGVYDGKGVSDQVNPSRSAFQYLCRILKDMNGYVLRLDKKSKKQFIIGDNPCVIFGNSTIWGVMMPMSPKETLLLINEEQKQENGFIIAKCPERLRLCELYSQFISSYSKIVYSEKYCTLG